MKRILIALMVVLGLVFANAACSVSDRDVADPSFKTLRYAGGFNEGSKFKECVPVGAKLVSNDKFYRYPTTQREDVWDTDNYNQGSKSADHPDMKINVNGVDMNVKMKVQFFLNTSCEPIKVDGKEYKGGVIQYFHEHIGKTRHAYFNKDGSYEDGWLWVMDNYISNSAEQLATPALRKYTPEQAWLNTDAWNAVATAVQADIQKAVDDAMESDLEFYKDLKVKVYAVNPEDDFKSLYKQRQAAQTAADTADLNRAAKVKEAEANAAVARAQAEIKKAEIAGYGGPDNYRCIYMADKGLNCAQPQYVVPGAGIPTTK